MRSTAVRPAIDDDVSLRNTLLISIWGLLVLLWSIFTPPHKTFPARVLIFQPLWGVRAYLNDSTWLQDLLLFLCLHAAFTYWNGSWRLLSPGDFSWLDLHDNVIQLYLKTFGLLGGCGMLAGGIVYRGHHLKSKEREEQLFEQRIDEQILPALLIPSRTAHSRIFPEKHAFSYTYLFVGIPVGIKGTIGKALSVDSQRKNWFHVRASDYLIRGGARLDLAEKLKRYLHTQGVTDRDYAFAYLVTAPRFLGYSFNPVSFWYLYDSETALKYMILEVNNTFDERRMYLLSADHASEPSTNGSTAAPKKLVFTETWEKDFHVSPFNSRKGSYSLRATDPLATYQETGQIRIDNNIVLRSSSHSPKIVAHVWSEGRPKEAANVGSLSLARFIAAWWWVGLATFPRIVWQAQKLFFQRKLHVWYRPEVTDSSIGRTYSNDETKLEEFFQDFLRAAVERSQEAIRVIYEPAHADGEEIAMYSPGFTYEEDQRKTIALQVLSPAFYGRFVHYAHAKEAFDREYLSTNEKNRTISIRNVALLPTLLDTLRNRQTPSRQIDGTLEQIRWSWLRRLRCAPPDIPYPTDTAEPGYTVCDIRTLGDSELDDYVRRHSSDAAVYRRVVTKLFLAQRFAFGIPALISALDWAVRISFILVTLYYCDKWREVDMLRPRELGPKDFATQDVRKFTLLVLLANVVHCWSFLKG